MQRLLTITVTVHWSAVFALQTIALIFRGETHPPDITLLGATFVPWPDEKQLVPAGFALLFTLCSALFLWALVTTIWGDHDAEANDGDVVGKAFAAASVAMTIVLAYGVSRSATGLMPAIAVHYAALIASFAALRVEHSPSADDSEQTVAAVLKTRAREASQSSLLARLANITAHGRQERL